MPEFVLRAYEVQGDRIAVRTQMKVIVGQALDTRTPLMHEDLRFASNSSPTGTCRRRSRARSWCRACAATRPHWAREGFEFVGAGGHADPVLTEAKLQAVLAGTLRIRQRPGPRNALGDIKFVFPNRRRSTCTTRRRCSCSSVRGAIFSHGCIRLEQPVALAAFALQGLPGWDEARIRAAMAADQPSWVVAGAAGAGAHRLRTALVKEGRVHFFDDIYGHDRDLARALRLPRP
jgi:hypothetical protein